MERFCVTGTVRAGDSLYSFGVKVGARSTKRAIARAIEHVESRKAFTEKGTVVVLRDTIKCEWLFKGGR